MKSLSSTRIVTRQFLSAGLLLLSTSLSSCAPVCELGACATQAVERRASGEGFTTQVIEGNGFLHQVSWRTKGASTNALWVFIEGDGKPWVQDGKVISDDPSPRSTLAFQLAMQTRGTVVYLGRPCYFQARADSRCSPSAWTSHRFSNEVIGSMNAALRSVRSQLRKEKIVLIGHSGGGTLAVLMANDLVSAGSPPVAVMTIAGNLDVEAWTSQHRYLPLTGSRNPANEPPLPINVEQFHLIGTRDINVTALMSARFLERAPLDRVWREARFDHDCCWSLDWPKILRRVTREAPALSPQNGP